MGIVFFHISTHSTGAERGRRREQGREGGEMKNYKAQKKRRKKWKQLHTIYLSKADTHYSSTAVSPKIIIAVLGTMKFKEEYLHTCGRCKNGLMKFD